MARDAGNTRRTARRINVGPNPRVFRDSLSSSDRNDFFRFVVRARSSFDGEVFNIPRNSNFNFQLQNANGRVIARSTRPNRQPENINLNLDPGTYFARVFWRKGQGAYRMRLSLTPDTAGETLDTARDLGNLTSSTGVDEYIGRSDPADIYRFTIDERLTVGATLTPFSAGAEISLLDASGNVLTGTSGSGTEARSLQRVLDPGTYFVRTTPVPGGNTRYNLTLNAGPAPDQGGNDFGSASAFPGFGFFPASIQEYVGNSDPVDYYTFTTTIGGDLKIDLTNIAPTADLNITLFDQFQQLLAFRGGAGPGGNEQIIFRDAQPGQYFVLVQTAGPGNNSTYRLTAVLTPEDKFGDDFADATSITDPLSPGILTPLSNDLDNPSIYQDFVGAGDVDVFRFTLTEPKNFFATRLKDFTGNITLQLFQAGNPTPLSGGGSALRGALGPGTYFLRVLAGGPTDASTYTLEAAFGERTSGIIVRDVNPGALDANADFLTDVNGVLFFAGTDGTLGAPVGLWRSEGTLNTTVKVGSFGSITGIANVNGTVYIAGSTVQTGNELWKWQPTGGPLGTLSLVADIAPGSGLSSSPTNLTAAGNNLFFLATPTGDIFAQQLYFTNGGAPVSLPNSGGSPRDLVYVQATDTIYYTADVQGVPGRLLFRVSNASTANPVAEPLQTLGSGSSAFAPRFVRSLKVVGSDVFFVSSEAVNTDNVELRRIAANGNVFTYDVDGDPSNGSLGSGNIDVAVVTSGGQSYAYFTAFDVGAVADQLLRVNLATSVIERVSTNISGSFVASNLTVFNDKVYFVAETSSEGTELWVTDPAATLQVTALELVPGAGSSSPASLVVAGGTLYFTADNGTTGTELYRLNETTGLPELALDINPGPTSSNPDNLIAAGSLASGLGQLFFVADDGVNGREVWTV
ncbi:pre-peptidase C-terminal domain-containing protein [Thermoleptolyngbya sp. C42_A2020_037]|uniref:pre-peptidase C-terminal domain-containing protein n=1 Tax=Thermoleptolyngbya sp. C42_A2020_037 TaxID=2747799 RepID=UPI0019EBB8FE|nr:pre-peptidase C-terminal domain-containing protein [Thermoleptolyngbya sp. C42_A2020_037]MBF2085150.1 pre-peptidase C-terminal domain-containing protein [Thermoleptolyngbya sp. C42_A2020_037]